MFLAIPLKNFAASKTRLWLDEAQAARLAEVMARHVIATVQSAGLVPHVVTDDDKVADWARSNHAEVLWDESDGGLNGAARAAAAYAAGSNSPWAILHADLPYLSSSDVRAFSGEESAIAPSYSGGTSLLIGRRADFKFGYGPASFHHHLQEGGGSLRVIARAGLALDVDDPHDLQAARANVASISSATAEAQ